MEAVTTWFKGRLTEVSTLDGTVILTVSVAAFLASPFIKYIAVAGAVYGVYKVVMSEKAKTDQNT